MEDHQEAEASAPENARRPSRRILVFGGFRAETVNTRFDATSTIDVLGDFQFAVRPSPRWPDRSRTVTWWSKPGGISRMTTGHTVPKYRASDVSRAIRSPTRKTFDVGRD